MEVLNLYRLRAAGTCPIDESVLDHYDVEVRSRRTITVEAILEAVREATLEPIFQEELASRLAETLDAHVTIYGTHSGVEVESEAGAD